MNPTTEESQTVYRGHVIPMYPKLQIRVTPFEYKKFIDAKLDHNLSVREAIIQKGLLCPCSSIAVVKSVYAKTS